ncbi:VIT1/CCC1 transporter family protein [Candidatus Woesearchaeota archaeon]|nr:VIT1/CCC1 transporter family protein [Candidatus Woesearchaeota archaeon]
MKNNLKDMIRDFVFGMEDGLVSNLGLVLGVYIGSGGRYGIILAGLSSMLAGAFSMAAGSYLSAKSQREVQEQEISSAKREIKKNPSQHLQEMARILKAEKFDNNEIHAILYHFQHNNHTFATNYIQKKVGLSQQRFDHPLRNAVVMFFSFLTGSLFPIIPFTFLGLDLAAVVAVFLTISALFAVGLAKSHFTRRNPWKSGLEITLVGLAAGVIGYGVGLVLSQI